MKTVVSNSETITQNRSIHAHLSPLQGTCLSLARPFEGRAASLHSTALYRSIPDPSPLPNYRSPCGLLSFSPRPACVGEGLGERGSYSATRSTPSSLQPHAFYIASSATITQKRSIKRSPESPSGGLSFPGPTLRGSGGIIPLYRALAVSAQCLTYGERLINVRHYLVFLPLSGLVWAPALRNMNVFAREAVGAKHASSDFQPMTIRMLVYRRGAESRSVLMNFVNSPLTNRIFVL